MVFHMFIRFVLNLVFGMLKKQCKYHGFDLVFLFLSSFKVSSFKVPRARARRKRAF